MVIKEIIIKTVCNPCPASLVKSDKDKKYIQNIPNKEAGIIEYLLNIKTFCESNPNFDTRHSVNNAFMFSLFLNS